jgi:hypothetical protein
MMVWTPNRAGAEERVEASKKELDHSGECVARGVEGLPVPGTRYLPGTRYWKRRGTLHRVLD